MFLIALMPLQTCWTSSINLLASAKAEVVDVVIDGTKKIKSIIVQFINPEAGKETRKGYKDLERKYGKPVVPIQRFEKIFSLDRQGTSAATATAYQFPIKLASAVTAHKSKVQPSNHVKELSLTSRM